MRNRLLIITQKVDKDDPILGFFHRWLEEFSKYFIAVTVICLQAGKQELPTNIRVLSLGKEGGVSRIKYLFNFYSYLWRERHNYDVVLVHMNPIYVVLAGWWWRLNRLPVFLWYTHKKVDWKLRLAEKMVTRIFSASPASFRLASTKLVITGHGIDTEMFKPSPKEKKDNVILSVGRLASVKNHHLLIEALAKFKLSGKPWELKIVGEAIYPSDFLYRQELIRQIKNLGLESQVELVGAVSPQKMINYYQGADLLVNLSDTGSLDKVVLEAMACGLAVVSSNEAYLDILPKSSFCSKNVVAIRVAIEQALSIKPVALPGREEVIRKHNLTRLIEKLASQMLNS